MSEPFRTPHRQTRQRPGSLADAAGLEANGITSDGHDYGVRGLRSNVREVASRVKRWSAMSLLTAKRSVGPAYR